jgi:hypothetical protein
MFDILLTLSKSLACPFVAHLLPVTISPPGLQKAENKYVNHTLFLYILVLQGAGGLFCSNEANELSHYILHVLHNYNDDICIENKRKSTKPRYY